VLALLMAGSLGAQVPAAQELWPNLRDNIERPLRYRPEGGDFVIENGAEFFNRPLYGRTTAFRVDAGDKPEFVLYLPGRGGNLRLGLRQVGRVDPDALGSEKRAGVNALHPAKWLHDAAHIISRYRPGGMIYEIRDPLLGPGGVLHVSAYALSETDGLIVRAQYHGGPSSRGASGIELIWAYGGVNGQRGRRDGDIGTEAVPIGEWFRLKPEFCAGNEIELGENRFVVNATLPRDQRAMMLGVMPAGSQLRTSDAAHWDDPATLLTAVNIPAPDHQVVVGRVALTGNVPLFLAIQRTDNAPATELDTYRAVTAPRVERADPGALASEERVGVNAFHPSQLTLAELPAAFGATEAHFAALRGQLKVETPDPYINAAVGALNVAADAVWDEPQGAVMHGAIAWRSKLLGWRGPYAMDALGWHDRAHRHLAYWATRQNTSPIPDKLPPPDADANLARSEAALHSNGDISNSHYDMNLVYIDALFRHLLWTGDLAFAREVWPVIERHLAWERRLFRREFDVNGEKLPLYEAYAAIWASDDLQYSGGGTAHASAYNYLHNRMAARVATLLGLDATPFANEADLISEGMRKLLWLDETGMFAESKDWLGEQRVHPSAALWSFYHTMDAGLVTPKEAARMAAYVAMQLPWLPSPEADGWPGYLIGTTNWMPYTWSLNNVVFSESMHGALGLWQADSPHAALVAMRGSILTSMFAGICPGNVGSMTYHDVHRRESQRDFADGSGTFSRALVEGLFGVRPDALKGELLVAPGFPQTWDEASMEHPRFSLVFRRTKGPVHRYSIRSRFGREMSLRFLAPTEGGPPPRARVNGHAIEGRLMGEGTWRRFEFVAPAAEAWEIEIEGLRTTTFRTLMLNVLSGADVPDLTGLPFEVPDLAAGKPEIVDLTMCFNDRVTEIFRPGKYLSPRSPFVSLAIPSQGIGAWAGHVNASAEIDDTGLRAAAAANGGRITLPDGLPFATPGPGDAPNVLFVSQWDNYPREATVPLGGRARRLQLLMTGSTNAMQSRIDNGEVVATYTDGTTSRLALRNPETWWPIEQDYFIDDYQFRVDAPFPTRVNLKTGEVRVLDPKTFKGQGRVVPGGAATVLELALDPEKELRSLTVRALANEVVIGLMAATLVR
jgi:hypothetical protein